MKAVYSPAYRVDIGTHVFPTVKYEFIKERLIKDKIIFQNDFIQPRRASDKDILLVHTPDYFNKLKQGSLSIEEIYRLELPYSPQLLESALVCVQGTIECCRAALEDTFCVHLGGGFHHAFADHGEGFCVFNDVAVAIEKFKQVGLIKRALVVDCDLHQGNGTADIFKKDAEVFTFSIHQQNNYPFYKPPSDLDINLADGTTDVEYLDYLNKYLPKIFTDFKPDLAVYIAGADPYIDDQLGGLGLTLEGLLSRDRFVYQSCKKSNVPVATVLGGGYAHKLQDTVTIHYNTIRSAAGLCKNLAKKSQI